MRGSFAGLEEEWGEEDVGENKGRRHVREGEEAPVSLAGDGCQQWLETSCIGHDNGVEVGMGNPSSAASASVTNAPTPQAAVNSDDPAWAHCICPDLTKKHWLKCKYCDKLCTAGITRIKYHLAGIKGFNVKKCLKVPTPVKEEMFALLTRKTEEKDQKAKEKQRDRDEIDIDNSEDESCGEEDSNHGNEVLVVKPKPTKGSSSSRSVAGGVTIDKFYKPHSIEESVQMMHKGIKLSNKVQTTLTTQKREERRDRACEYICQFFYEASIAHNTVTLPSFAHMLEAIGQFGRGLRGPNPYEMSGPFLQKRKQKVLDGFKNHKESWELTGCTVMTDAWTDRKGKGVMNLVVHSAHGVCFLDSVDCSSEKKDGRYIFDLVDRCIAEIGEENVVQVVTDNASVNTTAASLLIAKRPSIFWNGCAAHCLDLMLEDLGKLGPVEQTIASARQVTVFLYAHTRVLDLMRKFLKKDLVRSGVTRFATAYLNLKSLLDNKKELTRLFRSDELNDLGYLKKAKGKKANKVVRSEGFWKNVDIAVNFFEPLANVLRRMDSDILAMGFFHGLMLEAKKEISERFDNDESRFKVAWDIIDKRWDSKLKTPLHLASYYLNPYFYYLKKSKIEHDGSFRAGVIACITKMVEDEETQDNIIEELNTYQDQQGTFGHEIAIRQRRNKNFNPAKWWLNHGTSTPNLRKLASRIPNLTCSSSACERNWSVFEQVHTKKRNKLLHDRMRDLVFVKFNSKLRNKRESKDRDPLQREVDNVMGDDENEFITGIVALPNELAEQSSEDGPSQGESTSQAQVQAKRKRPVHPRKKKQKIRSLQSLLHDNSVQQSSSDSEDGDGDVSMQSSDSDKSPCASDSD
ncbi:uncharacterized protein LOC133922955 [Phragmites australis]|uniref:uncharacterized protein LOC133922955 n=1 Tax=Phragmites australis TaxID=29695 RepID=UPI002D7A2600|nr:uncharacterized protein LOC133922955 [Phragmites australis]